MRKSDGALRNSLPEWLAQNQAKESHKTLTPKQLVFPLFFQLSCAGATPATLWMPPWIPVVLTHDLDPQKASNSCWSKGTTAEKETGKSKACPTPSCFTSVIDECNGGKALLARGHAGNLFVWWLKFLLFFLGGHLKNTPRNQLSGSFSFPNRNVPTARKR